MIQRQNLQPQGLAVRKLGGQALYSHAVLASGSRTLFISGQLSRNEHGEIVGEGDMAAQIEQVGRNLLACLKAAGAGLDNLVRTITFVTDIDLFFQNHEARARAFGSAMATSTTVEVRRLSHPAFLVEVEAIAILP
jgi:2-iminobutanoate/2-iminopropanoate deaminase